MEMSQYKKNTEFRVRTYEDFFGPASSFFPHTLFSDSTTEEYRIDVFVYTLETKSGSVEVAVTNGMSDHRMVEPEESAEFHRRELIQYLPKCTEAHARRLRDMAWLPLEDGFHLDTHHSVKWPLPAVEGTPWKNAFFLEPLHASHREFQFEIDGDPVSLLWHIPISDEERAFLLDHGSNDFIDRMDEVSLPWIFDENNRPSLV